MNQLITEHLATWTTAPKGIKKLRELILELAVRGLLVPQDVNDEPASELLTKIAAEKARLVSEGKIKPPKPLAKISEGEKAFALPMGWEWERLGRLTYIEMGQSPSSSSYNQAEDGMPFFQGKADFGKIYPTPRYWCTEPQKIAYPDDILLSVRAPVGSTNLNNIECCIGRGLAALRPLAETNCYFLLYLMRSFQTKLESFATGTTFAAVSKSDVESFPVPLPPLAEQHRIVAKVDELMQLCDRLEQKQSGNQQTHRQLVSCLLTTLIEATDPQAFQAAWSQIAASFARLFTTENSIEQLKQTILQLAVMGKLVPQAPNDEPASELLKKIATEKTRLITEGKIKKQNPLPKISEQEKPFVLPAGWEWVRLGELCILENGDRSKNYPNKSILVEEGIPFINAGHLQNGLVDKAQMTFIPEERFNLLRSGKIMEGDILYCLRGSLGKIGFVKDINQGAIASSLVIVRLYPNLNNTFIVKYFECPLSMAMIKKYDNGTAQPNLSATDLAKFLIPLPPLPEQHRIVTKVDELMTLCEHLKTRLATAQTLQQQLAETLVQHVVT